MRHLRALFFLTLVISPLLSVTGKNEFSTGLNFASILNFPSLNPLNYVFLTFFFLIFVGLNFYKSATNFLISLTFLAFFVIIFPRHPTTFGLLGILTIFASFLMFFRDRAGITNISTNGLRTLFKIYGFYIIISLVVHIILLTASNEYYANNRFMGIFKNPNQMGFFLVGYYQFYVLKIREDSSRYDHVLPLILFLLLIMTGSRSAQLLMLLSYFTVQILHRNASRLVVFLLLLSVPVLYAAATIDHRQIIEVLTQRNVDNLSEVGNERLNILKSIFSESTAKELLVGRDASVGTGPMIYNQRQEGKIIWLDNMINVLLYNWGILGGLFLLFFLIHGARARVSVISIQTLPFIFFVVSLFFFVLGDFFPLPFLIVLLSNHYYNE